MADILKLKKKATDFEAKKQLDKAIAAYREVLELYERGEEEPIDIPLYNRVGDLLQASGNLPEAVAIWERAVDHYAEGGFYNLAIALCNKILRQSPGRAVVYYKLGKISAEKGFKGDARENFLEYAGRMQKAGNLDEAFRALKEYADIVPDQDDVRLMLADQLLKADRKKEAVEQLQIAYALLTREGRADDAEAVAAKMKAIDPTVEPKADEASDDSKGGGLVFLDLDAPAGRRSRQTKGGLTPTAQVKRATKATEGLDIIEFGVEDPSAKPPADEKEPAKPAASAPSAPAESKPEAPPSDLVIERTQHEEVPPPTHGGLAGLESTIISEPEPTPVADLPLIEEPPARAETPPSSRPVTPPVERAVTPPPSRPVTPPPARSVTPPPARPVTPPSTRTPTPPVPSEPVGDIPLIELPSAPEPPAKRPTPAPDLPLLDDPVIPATAEHQVPAARRSADDTPLPETAERRVPVVDADRKGTAIPTVRLSDFGSFGAPPTATPTDTPSVDPDTLEIISSEDSEVLPFSDSAPNPALVEEVSGPIFGFKDTSGEPPLSRTTSAVLANSVDSLRERATETPEDWGLRRQLAEALLDDGQRDEGIAELEVSLAGYERDGDLDTAAEIAEEIVRLAPKVIKYHQKRVEFAFRAADQRRLSEAYVELADALLGDGQAAKARVVYQRVLEIAPDDLRAQAALETIADAPVPEPTPPPRRSQHAVRGSGTTKPKAPAAKSDDEFVSLGDWLREDEEPKSTRMVVEEKEPTGDEQADFADMLRKFKQGVSDNVDDEDHEAHYDLGVAYKEMGLLDEAIGEFQKSLRGTSNRVRALEALGLCFVEKTQLPVAATILQRALLEPGVADDQLVGVLYLLGTISEELHLFPDAKRYYQRVFAVDIQFRDVGARLSAVERQLT